MIFFIMGSQRSGTTLLGLVLAANPNIEITEENDLKYHYKGERTFLLDIDEVSTLDQQAEGCFGFKVPRDTHRT